VSDDGSNPEVSAGDRIHIIASRTMGCLAPGTEHTVEKYGTTEGGAVYIILVDQPLALVSCFGDRWAAV